MIDWDRIVGFDWDDGNRAKNAAKHDVSPAEAEQIFFNRPLIVADDTRHSDVEKRFHALGRTDSSRQLHVTFTLRRSNTVLRVISARDMNRKERAVYADQA